MPTKIGVASTKPTENHNNLAGGIAAMRHFSARPTLTLCACGIAASVSYGAQPPNVVASDLDGNTAMGSGALMDLSNGTIWNTAAGSGALESNTTGEANTAFGSGALTSNTTGYDNAAFGALALVFNTTGTNNTGTGLFTLKFNVTGSYNTAAGAFALWRNQTGNDNTATGFDALQANMTGSDNTAIGVNALGTNEGGSNNVAIGVNAGYYVRGGHYNIEIGNVGTANDVGAIRIGTSSQQSSAYLAGVSSSHVAGAAVYVTSTGQLGVLASSERYKTKVTSMGSSTEKLGKLRPVSFHLKSDPKAGVQYGLIAEEVAKVYPELVIRGQKGEIEGVRYEELTPMLLNELQQQRGRLAEQQGRLAEQQADLQDMRSQLADLRRAMQERAH